MEIVYNPPPDRDYSNLAGVPAGDLFKLPKGHTVYMKIAFIADAFERIRSQSGESFAVSLTNGNCYSFANIDVVRLDGKLTVWEV